MKVTGTKGRFGEIVGALMRVGRDQADTIMEAEKKLYNGKKRRRKPLRPS